LHFGSEEELLAQLRPGIDGLILQFRSYRATFLPAVWESLPDPYLFLTQLKLKAGLPLDFWSPELRAERYTTEYFGRGVGGEGFQSSGLREFTPFPSLSGRGVEREGFCNRRSRRRSLGRVNIPAERQFRPVCLRPLESAASRRQHGWVLQAMLRNKAGQR
jgi:hypothetical protein